MGNARDDEGIVARVRAGDYSAFAALFERYHPSILRYLMHETGDAELAADLAQETFVDAFRSLDQLADGCSLGAWLQRIARNNLLVAWRWHRHHHLVSLDWLPAHVEAVMPVLHRTDESGRYCECALIEQVLNELSPLLREALLLHSLCGFTSKEIAQMLGIAPSAAERRISRAKEQFRARYQTLNEVTYDDGERQDRREGLW